MQRRAHCIQTKMLESYVELIKAYMKLFFHSNAWFKLIWLSNIFPLKKQTFNINIIFDCSHPVESTQADCDHDKSECYNYKNDKKINYKNYYTNENVFVCNYHCCTVTVFDVSWWVHRVKNPYKIVCIKVSHRDRKENTRK